MRWNFWRELKRKTVHFLSLLLIIFFIFISDTWGGQIALFFLVGLLIIFLELDFVRVELREKIPLVWRLYRRHEQNQMSGSAFFLIGAIIALSVFDLPIALAAVLMTTFGDMASALIGRRFGRLHIMKNRSIEGILAEFAVDLLIGYFLLPHTWIAVVMAVVATTIETMLHKLDDNLMIPLFAGFIGQLLTLIR
jgi:dolichol kinase